jgi:indole-3-glycerol phosphate synthase
MKTYLDDIIDWHLNEKVQLDLNENEILRMSAGRSFTKPFAAALTAGDKISIIAEIKKKSPSLGYINKEVLVGRQAIKYKQGGAACISVLTDKKFFEGNNEDLLTARSTVDLPILRKDFVVRRSDVFESKAIGADAILLIVAALNDADLASFISVARELNLETLVEVHDLEDIERAVNAGAEMIGVNQRDLYTFEVDRERALKMASFTPEGIVKVAESGIRGREDIIELESAGYDAVLIGELLMRSNDCADELRKLLER